MGNWEIWEVGRSWTYQGFGICEGFEKFGKSGDWGNSLYVAEMGNAVKANTWGDDELEK